MTFNDVIGQEAVKARLQHMTATGQVPHAMLFTGPEGCGKMPLAMAFACHLLEQGPRAEQGKAMIRKMQHPDLHFTYPTIKRAKFNSAYAPVSEDFAAEWRQQLEEGPYFTATQWIDRIKEGQKKVVITVAESNSLNRKLALLSSQGGYKVSVIWLPELMNIECANKMLKLLEEPPAQTVFLLVTEEPERLLETIRSRCQEIRLRRLTDGDITQALVQQRNIDDSEAARIAHVAAGSWTRALRIITADDDSTEHLEAFKQLMRMAYGKRLNELKTWAEEHKTLSRDALNVRLKYFLRMARESFMYNFRQPQLNYITQQEEEFVRNFAPFVNEKNIIELSELFEQCRTHIAQNTNTHIVFFDMAMKVILLLHKKKA